MIWQKLYVLFLRHKNLQMPLKWAQLSKLPFETPLGVSGTPKPPQPPKPHPWRTKNRTKRLKLGNKTQIKILRPLFTLQLLILPTRTHFRPK